MNNSKPVLSSNPALNVLKTIGSSPLFLTATILYTISLVGSAIFSIVGSRDITGTILAYASQLDLDPSELAPLLQYADQTTSATSIASVLLGSLFSCLVAVGMWITWATCRNRNSGNINTGGLTLCKVVFVIFRVLMIIALVGCGIGIIGSLVVLFSEEGHYGAPFVGGILFIFLIAVGVLVWALCYYISVTRAINRIRATAQTGIPDNRISNFLIGMCWLSAVGGIISGLFSLFVSPVSGLLVLCSAVSSILIALCLKKYREQMYYLMYPPVQPVYAQPYPQADAQPYAPQQEQPWSPPTAPYPAQTPAEPQSPVEPQNPAESGEQPQDPWDDKPQE